MTLDFATAGHTDRIYKEITYWLTSCKLQGLSDESIQLYRLSLEYFHWWCKNEGGFDLEPKNVRPEHINGFVAYMKTPVANRWGKGERKNIALSTASVATYFRNVRIFFNWLEDKGAIEKSPVKRGFKIATKKEPISTRYDKNLAIQDIRKIFESLSLESKIDKYTGSRNLALFALLLDSGIRRGELLSIKLGNFDWGRLRVKVDGKTGVREAFFSPATERLLLDYKDKHRIDNTNFQNPDSPFWLTSDSHPLTKQGFSSLIINLSKVAGVEFSAHRLRHTFASMLIEHVSIYDLSKMLGHTTTSTTELYLHQNNNAIQAAHNQNSPLARYDLGQPKQKSRRGRPPKEKE